MNTGVIHGLWPTSVMSGASMSCTRGRARDRIWGEVEQARVLIGGAEFVLCWTKLVLPKSFGPLADPISGKLNGCHTLCQMVKTVMTLMGLTPDRLRVCLRL